MTRRTATEINDTRDRASESARGDAWQNSSARTALQRAPERAARRRSSIEQGLIRLAQARPEWYAQAACKGNTEIMFDLVDTDRALAICALCEVRDPCRTQARRDREQGTWGGETEVERHELGRGSSVNVAARNKARQQEAHQGAHHAQP